jgi:hypothetical protein
MKIQFVSRYIALSEEDLVSRLLCPMDQGPLLCNLNLIDEIILYCLECNFKKTVGTELYSQIKGKVEAIDKL